MKELILQMSVNVCPVIDHKLRHKLVKVELCVIDLSLL